MLLAPSGRDMPCCYLSCKHSIGPQTKQSWPQGRQHALRNPAQHCRDPQCHLCSRLQWFLTSCTHSSSLNAPLDPALPAAQPTPLLSVLTLLRLHRCPSQARHLVLPCLNALPNVTAQPCFFKSHLSSLPKTPIWSPSITCWPSCFIFFPCGT